jgi:hypothetical protein
MSVSLTSSKTLMGATQRSLEASYKAFGRQIIIYPPANDKTSPVYVTMCILANDTVMATMMGASVGGEQHVLLVPSHTIQHRPTLTNWRFWLLGVDDQPVKGVINVGTADKVTGQFKMHFKILQTKGVAT